MYNGKFPKLDDKLLSIYPLPKKVFYNNWQVIELFEARNFQIQKATKFIKSQLEAIYTLWFLCLEIFLKIKRIKIGGRIYHYAMDKLFEIHDAKIEINPQILSSVIFLVGYFQDNIFLEKLLKKYKKKIDSRNLKGLLLSKFYGGFLLRNDFERNAAKQELTKEEILERIKIPRSISTHFETNEFCSTCGMYIPEEAIFAKFEKRISKVEIECPNPVCRTQFQPRFHCQTLKMRGQSEEKFAKSLIAPLRLLKKVGDFLFVRKEKELFDEEKGKVLYWNLLFYFNFTSLPAFFMIKGGFGSVDLWNLAMVYLNNYYVSQGRF